MMELWACGFNAWHQLQFGTELPINNNTNNKNPPDLPTFQCILKDALIELLRTSFSAILVRTSSGFRSAGFPDDFSKFCWTQKDGYSNVAIACNEKLAGGTFFAIEATTLGGLQFTLRVIITPSTPDTNSTSAEISSGSINEYKSFQHFLQKDKVSFGPHGDLKQIVANNTSFTVLSGEGEVWTWGDARYGSFIGRGGSDECPVSEPGLVDDLRDLPTGLITKIASGGFLTAALTSGHDLYMWGGGFPDEGLDGMQYPTPLDINGWDFLDVAIGVNHIVVLTTEGRILVYGDGSRGQLGLPFEKLETWKEVPLPLMKGQRIVGVYAGWKNSFVLIENTA